MGLREIRKHLGKLCGRVLMGTVANMPERNQTFAPYPLSATCDLEQCKGLEEKFGISYEANGHGAASSASTQRKAEVAVDSSAPTKKHLCAGDIARGILKPDSGATISNVLVVGTNGSMPVKRTQIHFDDPDQVPAFFQLLAAALKNSGFELHPASSSGIPDSEIWLTCPLNDRKKTSLSCTGPNGERLAA